MNNLIFGALMALSATFNVHADTLVLLSPFQTKQAAQQDFITAVTLLTEADLGETITVINGEDATTIATLSVPEDKRLASYNARINHNLTGIAALKQFMESAHVGERSEGAINLPFTLGEIARYHRHSSDILVMATARFDINGISQDIIDGDRILKDSNIGQSPQQGIFGTQGIEERLKGFRIHWLLSAPLTDNHYRKTVHRYWHLWLHHQRAELVSFTQDKNTVLRLLKDNAPALPMNDVLQVPVEPKTTAAPTNKPLFSLPVSITALDAAAWHRPQKVRIGIRWQGDVDLDIYAATSINQQPVYFANPSNAAARHFKDVLQGSDNKAELYETIEFYRPVNLCTLVIGINHYSGASQHPVQGVLRTEIGNKVYETAFTFARSKGNRGTDMRDVLETGRHSVFSKKYRIADIVGASNSDQHQQECNV